MPWVWRRRVPATMNPSGSFPFPFLHVRIPALPGPIISTFRPVCCSAILSSLTFAHAADSRLRRIPLSEITGCRIVCKLDNRQSTGSFKGSGARNALLRLPPVHKERGVIDGALRRANIGQVAWRERTGAGGWWETKVAAAPGPHPLIPDAPLRFEKKRCREELGAETECLMGNVMYFPRALPPEHTQHRADLRPPHT